MTACDTKAGWCACGEYHKKLSREVRAFGGPAKTPSALPCGCVIRNQQGATISGKFAPTKLLPNGERLCRCGKRWRIETRYVEVRS